MAGTVYGARVSNEKVPSNLWSVVKFRRATDVHLVLRFFVLP